MLLLWRKVLIFQYFVHITHHIPFYKLTYKSSFKNPKTNLTIKTLRLPDNFLYSLSPLTLIILLYFFPGLSWQMNERLKMNFGMNEWRSKNENVWTIVEKMRMQMNDLNFGSFCLFLVWQQFRSSMLLNHFWSEHFSSIYSAHNRNQCEQNNNGICLLSICSQSSTNGSN